MLGTFFKKWVSRKCVFVVLVFVHVIIVIELNVNTRKLTMSIFNQLFARGYL